MPDIVSKTEHVGVFSALMQSIKGVAVGGVFLCVAPLILTRLEQAT